MAVGAFSSTAKNPKEKKKMTTNRITVTSPEGKKVQVFPVDARELIANGWTTGERLTPADWTPESKSPAETKEPGTDDILKEIDSMNTKALDAYVEDEEIEIEDWEDMKLPMKRKALKDYIENPASDEDDEEDDL